MTGVASWKFARRSRSSPTVNGSGRSLIGESFRKWLERPSLPRTHHVEDGSRVEVRHVAVSDRDVRVPECLADYADVDALSGELRSEGVPKQMWVDALRD